MIQFFFWMYILSVKDCGHFRSKGFKTPHPLPLGLKNGKQHFLGPKKVKEYQNFELFQGEVRLG